MEDRAVVSEMQFDREAFELGTVEMTRLADQVRAHRETLQRLR